MELRLNLLFALFLFFLSSYSSAAPVSPGGGQKTCSTKCDESRTMLNYMKGKRYVYDFNNILTTHVPKGTRENVQVKISATAEFHIVDKCEITLVVKNAKMSETVFKEGKSIKTKEMGMLPKLLMKHPLPFGFNDGRITGICHNMNENRIALNVKRAMISQFQISMEQIVTPTSLTERDVSGDCLTEYQFNKETKTGTDSIVHIDKTKAIHGCANRKMSYSDLQGQNFDKPTETSQMPLLKGNQKCSLQVSRKGHLVDSKCMEQQVFRPFSGKKSGATFDIEQILKLVKIANDGERHKVNKNYGTLLMEHSETGYRVYKYSKVDEIPDELLNEICQQTKKDKFSLPKVIVEIFPRFVRSLRELDLKGLKDTKAVIGKNICKGQKESAMALFQDALPMVGTPEAAILMLDQLSMGKDTQYRRSWLFSLATMREPTIDVIEKLQAIDNKLDSPLTASSIVSTYCKMNEDCLEEKAVQSLIKQITERLGSNCGKADDSILLTLRAIGNLGAASDWNVINNCLNNRNIPMGHRVSAAQAIRKLNCENDGWQKVKLMDAFTNMAEDPELRINAYLSLMTCPDDTPTLKRIVLQLSTETSQQVGSFVWTHLSNLLETSQVFRKSVQNKLKSIKFDPMKFGKKFNLDFRRYSRNYEKSYYYEPLNSGISVESNVMFSRDSFIPRSATFNLTGGLFGKSISLVEIGVRTNNLDGVVQNIMSADFPKQNNAGSRMIHFDINKFKKFQRNKGEPSIDLYLRMFGNELVYNPSIKPLTYINKLKNMDFNYVLGLASSATGYSHTRMVMEAIISVPTLSGYSIELSLDVASTVNIKSDFKYSSNNEISTKFKPIGGLGVVGRMRVDAHCTEVGVEFHGTAFTNSQFGGVVKKTLSEVTLTLDAPQEKQTIVDLQSRMVLVSQRMPREQPDMLTDTKTVKKICSWKRMEQLLGLQTCISVKYVSGNNAVEGPNFPFTGNNRMSIQVIPVAKFTKYKVRGKYIKSETSMTGITSLEFELNAEGGKGDRQILFALNDKSKMYQLDLSLNLKSPMKTITMTANGNLKSRNVDAVITVDKKEMAKLTSRYKKGARGVTQVDIDIGDNKKFISATLSSAEDIINPNDFDHEFTFGSKTGLKSMKVIGYNRRDEKGKKNYKYSGQLEVGSRIFEALFDGGVIFDENDFLMISEGNGKTMLSYKEAKDIKFKYENNWVLKTSKGKMINNGQTKVTEHVISFDQTLLPESLSVYNLKGGSLVIQHGTQSNKPNGKRWISYDLKAKSMQHAASMQFTSLETPFSLDLNTTLKMKGRNWNNKFRLNYGGWREFSFDNRFNRNGEKYTFRIRNAINPMNVIQDLKVAFPKYLYHIHSKLSGTVEKQKWVHKGLIAWAPDKSYSSSSTINWGSKSSLCARSYTLVTKAFERKKLLGSLSTTFCDNIAKKQLALDIDVRNAKNEILLLSNQDATFRLNRDNFFLGGNVKLIFTEKVNFQLSTNHIYTSKKTFTEMTSSLIFKNKEKSTAVVKKYGYKLRNIIKMTNKQERTFEGRLDIYYSMKGFTQMKDTFTSTVTTTIPENGLSVKVDQKHVLKSNLWGEMKFRGEAEYWKDQTKHNLKSKHYLEGKLEMFDKRTVVIKGNHEIEGSYENMELEGTETLKANIKIGKKTALIHNSVSKLNIKTATFLYETKTDVTWKSATTEKKLEAIIKAEMKNKVITGNVNLIAPFKDTNVQFKMDTSLDLQKYTFDANGDLNGKTLTIKGNAVTLAKKATSIFEDPDIKITMDVSGNVVKGSGKFVGKIFYKSDKIKFIDMVYQQDGKRLKLALGYSNMEAVGLELRNNFKKPFEIVGMISKKPEVPLPTVELKLNYSKIRYLFKAFDKMKGKKLIYKVNLNKRTIMTITFSSVSKMASDGEMSIQIPQLQQLQCDIKFAYAIADNKFDLKTNIAYKIKINGDEKNRKIDLEIKLPFLIKSEKLVKIALIPNTNKPNEQLSLYLQQGGVSEWNFDVGADVNLPSLIKPMKARARHFLSFDDKTTTTSDLTPKATRAVDLMFSSTFPKCKTFLLQGALGLDNILKLKLNVDSTLMKQQASAELDLTNKENIKATIKVGKKSMDLTITKSGNNRVLISKVDGKEVGRLTVLISKGKLIDINTKLELGKLKNFELKFKQSHMNDNWDWKEWKHESSLILSMDDISEVKVDQNLNFEYKDDVLQFDGNFESNLDVIKELEVDAEFDFSKQKSSEVTIKMKGKGMELEVDHKVPNWNEFMKSSKTKFIVKDSDDNRMIDFLLTTESYLTTLYFENILFKPLSLLDTKFDINAGKFNFKSKSVIKDKEHNVNLDTNIFGYITGSELSPIYFNMKYNRKKQGKQLLNIIIKSTLDIKFTDKNYEVSSEMTFFSSNQMDFKLKMDQVLAKDYMNAEHSSVFEYNSETLFSGSGNYEIMEKMLSCEGNIKYKEEQMTLKAKYDKIARRYEHSFIIKKQKVKAPKFLSVIYCDKDIFKEENTKCRLALALKGIRRAIELKNTREVLKKGNSELQKISKVIKIAFDERKEQSVSFVVETVKKEEDIVSNNVRILTHLRNFHLLIDRIGDEVPTMISFQTGKVTRGVESTRDHVTLNIDTKEKFPNTNAVATITSNLFKKPVTLTITTNPNMKMNGGIYDTGINVVAKMKFGSGNPKLTMDFTMKEGLFAKDLKLTLTGGERFLKLYTKYDLENPVKTILIGADAKDWTRKLSIAFEKGRLLETTVDNGKTKQTFKLTTEKMPQNDGYRNVLEIDYPEVQGYLKIISQINRYPLSLLVIVNTDKTQPDDKMVINGRFMNSRNVLIEIKRVKPYGKKTKVIESYAYAQVTLGDAQNIITQLKWRPDLIEQIKKGIKGTLAPTKLQQYLMNRGEGLWEVLKRFMEAVSAPVTENINLVKGEALARDLSVECENFVKMLKKVPIKIKWGEKTLLTRLQEINKIVESWYQSLNIKSVMNTNQVGKQYKKLYEKLVVYMKNWNNNALVSKINGIKQYLINANVKFNGILDELTIQLKKFVNFTQSLKAGFIKKSATLTNKLNPTLQSLGKSLKEYGKQIQTALQKLIPDSLYDGFITKEDIKAITELSKKLEKLYTWMIGNLKGNSQVPDWQVAMQLLFKGDLKKAYKTYFKPELTKTMTWSPEKGSIKWQVYLPYDIKSLQSIPMAMYVYTQSQARTFVRQTRQGTFQLGKLYQRLNDEFLRFSFKEALQRQLPPFRSHAWIAGSQHFVTFDGINIEHTGECTYLLAHDFVDNSFSVLAQYQRSGKKIKRKYLIVQTPNAALYICSKGSVQVKTSSGGSMALKMLPFTTADLSVTRWKKELTVSGPHGLTVVCNLIYDVCRISLSRWSHAKVNGLLGTNDNEEGNDLLVSLKASGDKFAIHSRKWTAGKCSPKNFAVIQKMDSKSAAYKVCSRQFKSGKSSFSRCFTKVRPENYLQACMNMYKMNNKNVCPIYHMYVSKCRSYGMRSLRIPLNCIRCGMSNKQRSTYRRPAKSDKNNRHFIFIIEDKPCLVKVKEPLKELLRVLAYKSRRSGKPSTHTYSLIGFGGKGEKNEVTSYLFTSTKDRGNEGKMKDVLNRLTFDGDSKGDIKTPMKAAYMALDLDDDVKKASVILFVSCSSCVDSGKYRFSAIDLLLKARGIEFHYITPYNKFGKHGGSNIVGIFGDRVYNEKGRFASSNSVKVSYPKDSCSALSKSSGGSIWSLDGLLGKKRRFVLTGLKTALNRPRGINRRCSCRGNNNIQCRKQQ